jgi:hypothetical protein
MNTGWYMLIVWAVILSGCTRTEYKPYEESGKSPVDLYRTVNFYVNPAFREDPPRCVLVLPSQGIGNPGFTGRIEKALVRHLSDNFLRVVSGSARDGAVTKLAFDMAIPADRRDFSQAINCDTVFEYKILKPRHANMLFWSEIRIGLEARLIRQRDELELWKARHIARRSDGGVSFSPLGLAVNAYDANALSSDGDAVESVTEDLVRRLMKSMPLIQ